MKIRAFVFDDDQVVRAILRRLMEKRGYSVCTFSHPALCQTCRCPRGHACADIIITDFEMPAFTGVEFVENQILKGCRSRNIAIITGHWHHQDLQLIRSLGFRIFRKPLNLKKIGTWLDGCEKNVDPKRILAPWFFSSMRSSETLSRSSLNSSL